MNLEPMYDRVIVEKEVADEMTPSGLYIPDSAKEKPQQGTVIGVGPGKILPNGTRQPMTLKIGDRILFGRYAGSEVMVDKKSLLLLREEDVFARINAMEAPSTPSES